jgi:hypothetical protein
MLTMPMAMIPRHGQTIVILQLNFQVSRKQALADHTHFYVPMAEQQSQLMVHHNLLSVRQNKD